MNKKLIMALTVAITVAINSLQIFAAETRVTNYYDDRKAAMALNYDTELYLGGMIHSGNGYDPATAASRAQNTLDGWPNIIADCETYSIPVSFNICGYEAVFGDTGRGAVSDIDIYQPWHGDLHWSTNTWYSDMPLTPTDYMTVADLSGTTRSYSLVYGGPLTERTMNSTVPFEISYHNFGHESLSDITADNMNDTFRLGVAYHKRIGSKLTAEAPPWNNNPQAEKYPIYVQNGIFVFNRSENGDGLPYEVIDNLWIVSRNGYFDASSDMTGDIDSAITNGTVLAYYSHPEDGFQSSSRGGFQTSLAYAKLKVDSGSLWATTLSEIGKYWEAKSDVNTTNTVLDSDTITVDITLSNYDVQKFGIPYLTFITSMPNAASYAKITVNYPLAQTLNSSAVRISDANVIYTIYLNPAGTTNVEIKGVDTPYTGGVNINTPVLNIDSTPPTDANNGQPVTITAAANSTDAIYSVNIIYQRNTDAKDSKIMDYNATGGVWQTTIGPFTSKDHISYYVSATDNSGRRERSANKSFTISSGPDTIAPQWRKQTQSSTNPAQGATVQLGAEGTDDVALRFATLATDETGAWEKKSAYGSPMSMGDAADTWTKSSFNWSNPAVPPGTTVSWRIYYEDASGNEAATGIISFMIAVPDTEAPQYSEPNVSSTVSGDTATFSLKWTDDRALDGYVFSIDNGTGTFADSNYIPFDFFGLWWNDEWSYRKTITIDNTAGSQTLTDYAVMVTIDTANLTAQGKMTPHGGDIRFVADNNELNFWVESGMDTNNTRIWVKVPSIPASSTKTIYMYYGSPNHRVPQGNGTKTFAAFDDFGGRGWEEFKYSGNPVMGPGSPAGGGGTFSSVIREDANTWRMYASYDSDNSDIGLSTSSDGVRWYHQGVVLRKGVSGSWDASNIWCPGAWKEGANYYMLYSASGSGGIQMGLATSADGNTWTKYASNPVFNDPTWARGDTEAPGFSVLKENGIYYIMYNTLGSGKRQSSVAYSPDLINWTPVYSYPRFPGGPSGSDWNCNTFCGNVFKYDDMFYLAMPGQDESRDYCKFGLYASHSPAFPEADTEFKGIIMIGNRTGWDASDMDTPWAVQFDDKMHLYYAACGSCWSQTGLAIINDIPLALTQAYPPGNYIDTTRTATASLQIMPPVGWQKSIAGYLAINGQNFEITLSPAMTGRAVLIDDHDSTLPLELYMDITSMSKGTVSAWIRRDSNAAGDYDLKVYGDTQTTLALSAGLGGSGTFHYWNGALVDTGMAYDANTWYLVKVEFDTATDKYNFAVYDTSFSELVRVNGISFGTAVTNGIDRIKFATDALFSGYGYLDDVAVNKWNSAEPEADVGAEATPEHTMAWSTATAVLNSTAGRTIRWKFDANDTSGNETASEIFSFVTAERPLNPWWNSSWQCRILVGVNAGNYSRTNEPIEYNINFTSVLAALGKTGVAFDSNSVRVIEYSGLGDMIGEVPSQFDKAAGYNATTNASGTIVWIMSGTTPANTIRHYYIYFDTAENPKSPPAYSTALNWNSTSKILSNTKITATLGSASGRSGIASLKYNSLEYLTGNGMSYIDGAPSTYLVLIDGPVKKTVKLTAVANGNIEVTLYDLAEFTKIKGNISGSGMYFAPFPYTWGLSSAVTAYLHYVDGTLINETAGDQGWLGHAPTEGWASYDGAGGNKGFSLITDSNTLSLSNNFWRYGVGQLMLPGFNPTTSLSFPIYPMSWILFSSTYQDARDFWFKLSSPVGITEVIIPFDCTINASAGTNGSISPSGAIGKNYGQDQLFTAMPYAGYTVDTWFVDGNSVQVGGSTFTLANIQASHTVGVTFKILTCTVTASAGTNGLISPSGTITKNYGDSQLFTATPSDGYMVGTWSVDSGAVQTGGATYTLSSITANHTVSVTFEILVTYTVTASSGANGSIDPSGTITKNSGDSQLFTATPSDGYAVDTWLVDGNSVQTGGTTYTLSSITANHTVSVTFKILNYTVTASAGANGTIDPCGSIVKSYGQNQLFTAMPDAGYVVDTWFVDGNSVQFGGDTFALANIQASHTVEVTFSIAPDTEAPQYSNPNVSSTVSGDTATFSLQWTDNKALDGYIFSIDNGTGTFVDSNYTLFDFSSVWWNQGWNYRKTITIDNTANSQSLTDYTILTTVDTASLMAQGKMNAHGGDIRFIADNNELNFWVESGMDTNSTRIWVKVPSIPASSTKTIYMYYGNPNHKVPQGSGAKTFAMFDDFGGRGWEEFKYSGNPVMGPGSPAGGGGTFSSVIRENANTWRMYASYDSDNRDIGLSTSADGIRWYHQGVVLRKGAAGQWDNSNVWCPVVWKEGATYYMLYPGQGSGGIQMGLATSSDGITWTKYAGNPVFNDPGWAHGDTEAPGFSILKEEGVYYIMYNTLSSSKRQSSVAFSTDLIHWTPAYSYARFPGAASTSDWNYFTFCGHVTKYDDMYYLIFSGQDGAHGIKFGLYASHSPLFPVDDTEFKGIIMVGGRTGWDASEMDTPWAVQFDDKMHLYYAGCGVCWSQTGLAIINDIPLALTQAYPPGNYLDLDRTASPSLQIMPPVGWQKSIAGYQAVNRQDFQITLSPAVTGRAVVIADHNALLPQELYKDITSISKGTVSAWMRRDNNDAGDYDLKVYGDTQAILALSAGLGGSGKFHYWNGTLIDTGMAYDASTWYMVKVEFDTATDKYNFVVYDTSFAELLRVNNISFGGAITNGIDRIKFATDAAFDSNGYVDDPSVKSRTATEPAAAVSEETPQIRNMATATAAATLNSSAGRTIRWKMSAKDTSSNQTISEIFSFVTDARLSNPWWNSSWHYRLPVDISSTCYSRTNEPVEYNDINFTSVLAALGKTGVAFDSNSVRVIEYSNLGDMIGEVNSQFDKAAGYNATTNASGTIVWIMSGTTPANTIRHYYIYFDTAENPKSPPAYSTALNWNSTSKILSNTKITAALGSAGGRSGIASLKYNGLEYLTGNGMVYIDGAPSTYLVLIDGPVKKTVKLTAAVNGNIEVTLYDLAEFTRIKGNITGSYWSFTPFPYTWSLTAAVTANLHYVDGTLINETAGNQLWLSHAPTEGWASYDGAGGNKGFSLITDSSTLALSNNFWRYADSSSRQLMLPGFYSNKPFPIYPMSWILFSSTYQDARDFWSKLSCPIGIAQNTPEPYNYTITASADADGTIAPSGTITENYGSSQVFTATPHSGYEVDKWYLDSSLVQIGGSSYKLTQIHANHTVNVTFKPLPPITISGMTGLDGVVMNGLPGNPVTSGGGLYSATVPYNWSGTITPTLAGYNFEPVSKSYTNVAADHTGENYVATPATFTMSGTTGLDGVVMNGLPGNPVTSGGGLYSATVPYNWSGTVTPTLAGYNFEPVSKSYTNVAADHTGENYVATPATFTISGSTGLDGVTMNGLPGNPVTSGGGLYSATVPYNWSGTVTPTLAGYNFEPVSKSYVNVAADHIGENYVATPATFTITGSVGLESFVGSNRAVTFVATGGTPKTWTQTLSFSGSVASFTLTNVPEGTTGLSAKTAWNLRNKLAVTLVDGQAVANFTGIEKLLGGDLNGSNTINMLDYTILRANWFTTNPVADITGNGYVNTLDYTILKKNFFKKGDPE
jgi:hypothetical protein